MSADTLVVRGKSKDVYRINDGRFEGKYRLVFTDRATGYIDNGKAVFDPGRDEVVGEIPGKGAVACKFATYFFELLQKNGVPTHFIESPTDNEMIVEPALPLGMEPADPRVAGCAPLQNLEFTWRNNATGSFWRRYPFVKPCKNLNMLIEAWTKGDVDTLITFEALEASGALDGADIARCVSLVKDVARIVSEEFAAKGLHVLDGKLELGRLAGDKGRIALIDEVSPDVLRVCKGYKADAEGDCAVYRDCAITKFENGKRSITNRFQVKPVDFAKVFGI